MAGMEVGGSTRGSQEERYSGYFSGENQSASESKYMHNIHTFYLYETVLFPKCQLAQMSV